MERGKKYILGKIIIPDNYFVNMDFDWPKVMTNILFGKMKQILRLLNYLLIKYSQK